MLFLASEVKSFQCFAIGWADSMLLITTQESAQGCVGTGTTLLILLYVCLILISLFFNHSFSLDTTHRYNHTKRQDWKTWTSMMKAFYLQTYCFGPAEFFFVWLRLKQNTFNKSIRCIPMSNQKRMFFFQLVQRHESCYVLLKVANLKHSKRRSFSNFSCMFLNPNIFFQFEF